jgi:hypothetical protein
MAAKEIEASLIVAWLALAACSHAQIVAKAKKFEKMSNVRANDSGPVRRWCMQVTPVRQRPK